MTPRRAAAKAVELLEANPEWVNFCCNLLEDRKLVQEFDALFGDAPFWVSNPFRPTYERDCTAYPISQRNFDRACCLLMFAEIMENPQ